MRDRILQEKNISRNEIDLKRIILKQSGTKEYLFWFYNGYYTISNGLCKYKKHQVYEVKISC